VRERGLRPAATPGPEVTVRNVRPHRSARSTLLAERAYAMRVCPTDTEQKLWRALRCRGLGIEFRRQVVIANRFIVDFLAPSARLVVEIDGGYHERRRQADASRDRKLARLGYRVLRLQVDLVQLDLARAIAQVRAALGT
jgi:very-short-patch-repair endonuclease